MAVHNNSMDLETVEQVTGGGGSQKLYRAPPGWVAPTNKTPIGVDIRGQGGFAVLAPSLHDSGKAYEWLEGRSPDDMPVTAAPDWLLEAVEALVRQHGGVTGGNGATPHEAPQGVYDPLSGRQIDGRETYMRDVVWGAVVDWYRDLYATSADGHPRMPSDKDSRLRAAQKYLIYEDHVSPQREHPPGLSKIDMLELEGRGPVAFHVKWTAATRQWDGKVRDEALKLPPPGRSIRS